MLLEILLFLSAMLAGLTGLISGDRAVEARQVERTAIAAGAAVELAGRTAEAAVRVAAPRPRTLPALALGSQVYFAPASTGKPQPTPVDERRLE